jgi:hypothetical protein
MNQSLPLQSEVQGVKAKNIDQFVSVGNRLLTSMQALGYSASAGLTELPLTASSSSLLDRSINRLLQVRLQAPANLWSMNKLTFLRSPLVNDFEVKVLQALASTMQVKVTVLSTLTSSTTLELIHNLECSIK